MRLRDIGARDGGDDTYAGAFGDRGPFDKPNVDTAASDHNHSPLAPADGNATTARAQPDSGDCAALPNRNGSARGQCIPNRDARTLGYGYAHSLGYGYTHPNASGRGQVIHGDAAGSAKRG